MNQHVNITDDNFLLMAAKAYDHHHSTFEELEEDISRLKYLNKLFYRFQAYGLLKERLILNHLIVLFNVFEQSFIIRALFLKINPAYWSELKTFLVYLSRMPEEKLHGVNNSVIDCDSIPLSPEIINVLRSI